MPTAVARPVPLVETRTLISMPPTRLPLIEGADPRAASQILRERVRSVSEVLSANVITLRDQYLRWVEDTERALSYLTRDAAVLTMLQTPRHWQIQSIVPN